jgi:hypothetical protein
VQLAASYRRQDRAALQRRRSAGIETRFVIGLLLLKHIFALSDEDVCEVYDPYFQYSATGRSDALLSAAIPHRGLWNTGALSRYAHGRVTNKPQSRVSRRLTVTAPKTASWKSFLDGGRPVSARTVEIARSGQSCVLTPLTSFEHCWRQGHRSTTFDSSWRFS